MTRLFAFYCRDGEHGEVFRDNSRAALLDHFKHNSHDFLVAGPLWKNGKAVGSLLVIRAEDEDAARRKLEAVPYFEIGVWHSIRADEFTPLFGAWASDGDTPGD